MLLNSIFNPTVFPEADVTEISKLTVNKYLELVLIFPDKSGKIYGPMPDIGGSDILGD